MGYQLDNRGIAVCFSAGTRDFLFSRMSRVAAGPSLLYNAYKGLFFWHYVIRVCSWPLGSI